MASIALIFDIDGTLVDTHGAGESAMEWAWQSVAGIANAMDGFSTAGLTDMEIFCRVGQLHGVAPAPELLRQLLAVYLRRLRSILPDWPVRALPGAAETLRAVAARPDLTAGIGTGNLRLGAHLKLKRVGLHRLVSWGGYGEHGPRRADVIRAAVALVRRRWPQAACVVVGDTPFDIQAARAAGVACIAVASGRSNVAELVPHRPDAVIPDLAHGRLLAALDTLAL